MGNFSEAVRQMHIEEAKCPNPKCGAKNERGKNDIIKIDVHLEAWCSKCGHEWSVPK